MNLNILLAGLKLFGLGTPHTANGATTHTQLINGIRAIDCSYLVYQAVTSAGYGSVLPSSVGFFSTKTLFTDYAAAATDTTKFTRFTPAEVSGGLLQPGDVLLLKNSSGGGHTGIFYGYDSKSGNPLFYNVGNSKGTIVSNVIRDGYTIQGALRPQASQYNPTNDITLSIPYSSGTGLTIPTQAADPGVHYNELSIDSKTCRFYANGVLYTRDTQTTQEYWSIPTATGGSTDVTKFSNGLITTQTFLPDGTIDANVPATVTLDASASADMQAAFDAWKAAGGDPANVNPEDLRLDQTTGGTSTLLDSRLFNLAGAPYKNNAVLIGESSSDGSGGDMLRGGEGNDFLIGSSGDDVLYGGAGNDVLAGGGGDDTYILDGAGKVTIEDKIGNNHVLLNGKELKVLIRQTDGSFKSADGKITGALNGGDLILQDEMGAQVTLNKNFQEGDFGITFQDAPVDTPATNVQVFNPLPGQGQWTTMHHMTDELSADFVDFKAVYDLTNNQPLASESTMGYMTLTSGSDNYTGSDGNEMIGLVVDGDGGNDTVDGGGGHDYIRTGSGNDILIGGTGSDLLAGSAGNDRLYGEAQSSAADAIDTGNLAGTGVAQRGDWLSGGTGDDQLIGSTANDVLMGGEGQDLLIAGAGDDNLYGDLNWDAIRFEWKQDTYLISGLIDTPSPLLAGGADTLYCGAGDDRAWGGMGNDVLYGEDGNDVLVGNDGSDVLMGGNGNDYLSGDGVVGGASANYFGAYIAQNGQFTTGQNGYVQQYSGLLNYDATIQADSGHTTVVEGNDYLDGGEGNDILEGNGGNDTLLGGTGDDTLYGDNGNNQGAQGDDYLDGGDGNDILYGEGGNDTLLGGAGDDQLYGGSSVNTLDGGAGNDRLFSDGVGSTLLGGAVCAILLGRAKRIKYEAANDAEGRMVA